MRGQEVRRDTSRAERGQTLVIVAAGMVILVAMIGVVIDVGMQWAHNRTAQNGADAAAHAGAIVIMRHLTDTPQTDADVELAVDQMAAEGEIDLVSVEYTDYQGEPINVDVGSGGSIPTTAQGVRVVAERVHETLLARVVGVMELSARTEAAAVTGPVEDPCPEGQVCALLPVTVPNTQVTCDGQNKAISTADDWELGVELILPLCGNNPGSVGWIDWDPPGGGESELAAEICSPNPPEIALPDWFWVTAPGNTNGMPVQTCLEKWIGKTILIPLFDDTCKINPVEGNPCPVGEEASGQNSWYHFPTYAAFHLTGVYINGNHAATCDTGNGATSCLSGSFEDTSGTGTVGQYVPPDPSDPPVISEFFAVQLVR